MKTGREGQPARPNGAGVPRREFLAGLAAVAAGVAAVAKGLSDYGFAPADLRAIERDNALTLFPRLKTA